MMLRRILYILPALIFVGLAVVLYASLHAPGPSELPSALIDKPAPLFALPALDARAKRFDHADLTKGHVTVVNMFASWCVPCRQEAPALAQLAAMQGVTLYGVVWKDKSTPARAFLDEAGNPYAAVDIDEDGRAGLDWGVSGVPETFVIDGRGIVRFKLAEPLVGDTLTQFLLPAIERAQKGE
ncbi:MAG TPA: DsbE family thiol:disulfide interchange protein [Rhizomicrobium sp.]|jgi:cytochrome c biogenesis protein CcmG/thiol:disulfide interchange protein DsbE